MRRRDFITLLGGAAVAWPISARAQQSGPVWRVGVLGPVDTPAARVAYPHFLAELRKLGFREGENLIVDIRRIDQGVPKAYVAANELVAAKTNVLVAFGPDLPLQAAIAARPAFSREPSQPICRLCRRASMNWSSTLGLPGCSA
jgi:hypothetical protein